MSGSPSMWDDLNAACVEAFREEQQVVFLVGAAEIGVEVAYQAPYEGTDVNGMPVERPDHTLHLETALLPAGTVEGGEVRVRGRVMTITEISGDDGGMTRLLLAEYRA